MSAGDSAQATASDRSEDSDVSTILPAAQPPVGDLPAMFGRYRIIKELGRGGMGAVYLAQDTQLDRPVALKVPNFSGHDGPKLIERFYREAKAAATLQHPNICAIHDVGQIDGRHYLTMAYVEGRSLAEFLRKTEKPLTQRQIATLVYKIALALEEAHRKKIIHRDLKPANVMLNKRGEPVVMDFGLAKRLSGEATDEAHLTRDGMVMGTPAYMAPEQARGALDEIGPTCDVYSLGVILYELLAGRLPFTGEAVAVLAQVLADEPTPPSKHAPDVNPALEAICLKAMAKKPTDRYGSMAELAKALGNYLKGMAQPTQITSPEPKAARTSIFTELSASTPLATRPRRSSRDPAAARYLIPIVAGVAFLGFIIVGSVVGYLILGRRADHHRDDDYVSKTSTPPVISQPMRPTIPTATAPSKPRDVIPDAPAKPVEDPPKPIKEQPAAPAPAPPAPSEKPPAEPALPMPDLAQLKLLFRDDFDSADIKPSFPEGRWPLTDGPRKNPHNTLTVERGYGKGYYYVRTVKGDGTSYWTNGRTYAPHVLDVTAKMVNAKADSDHWYVLLWRKESNAQPAHGVAVRIFRDGKVSVWEGDPVDKPTRLRGPVRHAIVKTGENENRMTLVVLNKSLEVFVNGTAVTEPITFENPITPCDHSLGSCSAQVGTEARFTDYNVHNSMGLRRARGVAAVDVPEWQESLAQAILPKE